MKKYKQLTLSQRYPIQSFLQVGLTQTQIAFELGVNKSTISRELTGNIPGRGQTTGKYIGEPAQRKTDYRHHNKVKSILLTDKLKECIANLMMVQRWSPELIAKRLAKDGELCVSHEILYKWIWTIKHSHHRTHIQYKNLHKYLRHTGRRRKRGNLKDNRGAIMERINRAPP